MKNTLFIFFASLVLFTGCKKSDRDEDDSTNSSEDYALSTGLIMDVFKIVHQASNTSSGIVSSTSLDSNSVFGCDTIIFDALSSPKTLTIEFDENCTSSSVSRGGVIYSTYSGYYDVPGTVITIHLYNYSYNEHVFYSGSISCQLTDTSNGVYNYSFNTSDIKIKNKYNQNVFYNANYQIKVISGSNTPLFIDDEYLVTGSMTGRAFRGNGFSAQINDSLTASGNCNWITSGNVSIKPDTKSTRNLDFGGGGCDATITISIYELDYEYSIP
ncbi:MAG: hypothetical protein KDD29_05520 [Flavobacteriales bacterium]|nr:hypothetical protein [Flavobacteriales bacterium]MCB9335231.1 hypothetical protein [Flavobacteriales bacterium]